MINFSLLSTYNNPMIGLFINKISKKHKIHSVIFDSKEESEKDLKIWNARTNNKIPNISLCKIDSLITFYFIKNHSSDKMLDLIEKNKIKLLINCGTPRIIKGNVLNKIDIGILNCHPGILPNYRGCTCVEWALYNRDPLGNTCHLMTDQIDEGPIIYTSGIKINSNMDYQAIRILVYLDSINSIIKAIDIIKKGKYDKDIYPTGGKYYKPIDKVKMKMVIDRINNENLSYC